MALAVKSDIIEQFYWEANRWAELATKIGRTSTGTLQETSATSGNIYNSTTGEDGILTAIQAVILDYLLTAQDYNNISTELSNTVQNEIVPLKLDVNQIKVILEQAGLADFANQTGNGFFTGFGDTNGIDTGSTTATIDTGSGTVTFDDTGNESLQLESEQYASNFNSISLRIMTQNTLQAESDGAFTNVNTIDVYSPYDLTTTDTLLISNNVLNIQAVTDLT